MTLSRIIIHWTVGTYFPNSTDRQHYHFLVDGNGKIHTGKFKPEDNINCKDGKYAQHTGGGNTGSIGISLCGMLGFRDSKNIGNFPLNKTQLEACYKKVAELCKQYNIPVTPQTIMTHRTFGLAHPKTESAGKIDICYLPPYPHIKPDEVDDFIRSKVQWYLEKL